MKSRSLLRRVVGPAHGALLRTANARRYDEVEAEFARLDLLLMEVTVARALLLAPFALVNIYLLQSSLITATVSQLRVPGGIGIILALARYRKLGPVARTALVCHRVGARSAYNADLGKVGLGLRCHAGVCAALAVLSAIQDVVNKKPDIFNSVLTAG